MLILWILPPLSNSWIITIIWLYIALNMFLGRGSTQLILFFQPSSDSSKPSNMILRVREDHQVKGSEGGNIGQYDN